MEAILGDNGERGEFVLLVRDSRMRKKKYFTNMYLKFAMDNSSEIFISTVAKNFGGQISRFFPPYFWRISDEVLTKRLPAGNPSGMCMYFIVQIKTTNHREFVETPDRLYKTVGNSYHEKWKKNLYYPIAVIHPI